MTQDAPPARLRPVTHDEPPYDPEYDGRPTNGRATNDRTPPHDRAAEQAVLATLIYVPDAHLILDPELDSDDFYWPAHTKLWDAWHTLRDTNALPPDTVTLNAELVRRHDTDSVRIVTDLANSDANPALALQHARIVRDAAKLRVVDDLATGFQQLVRTANADKVEFHLGEALQRLDETVTRFGATAAAVVGTGLKDLSWLLGGTPPVQPPPIHARRVDGTALFYAGKVNGLIGDPESAKAQPYTAEIQTPTGPKLMGDMVVGDTILNPDGTHQTVKAIHEQGHLEVWELTTSDGVTIECCADHLWTVQDHNDRARGHGWRTITTRQLADTGTRQAHGRPRWHLPEHQPSDYPEANLPLDPYLVGLLIGDGHLGRDVRISTVDPEILEATLALAPGNLTAVFDGRCSYALTHKRGQRNPLQTALRELGLANTRSHTKHIPAPYLSGSIEQRLALLQGLMDTDGTLESRQATFTTVSPQLADDLQRLVQSLGGTAATTQAHSFLNGQRHRDRYRTAIRLPLEMNPFRLARKATPYAAHTARTAPKRNIADITPTGRHVQMRCIAVSNPNRLYLTNGHVPTHNTWLAQIAGVEALNDGGTFVMIDVDHNGPDHTAARLVLLGARLEHLADPDRFRYYEPEEGEELRAAITEIVAFAPTVLVVDSIGEVFPMLGVNTNDGDEITSALRLVCTKPANAGSCVITIDHLPKSADARATGFAIGSIAKKRMIRGSYLRVDAKVKPVPGGKGIITLRIEKDTSGVLRQTSGGGHAGTLTLDSTQAHVTTWSISSGEIPTNDDGTFRPTGLMEKVSKYIEDNDQCNFTEIRDAMSTKKEWVTSAVQILVAEGFVVRFDGARRAKLHHSIAPYRQTEDDHVTTPE